MVAGEGVGQYDYVSVRAGQIIGGIRARSETLALVMTSAPIRYDTSAGGMLSKPLLGPGTAAPWGEVPELPGRFVRPLADGPHGAVWLSGGRDWVNEDGPWHVHDSAEEVFVLEGGFTITERLGEPDEIHQDETYRCGPGTYTFRLPGRPHGGPGSRSSDLAIAFHRMHGPRAAEWMETWPPGE